MKNQKLTLKDFELCRISKTELKSIQGCGAANPPAGATNTSSSSPDGGGVKPPTILPPPPTK